MGDTRVGEREGEVKKETAAYSSDSHLSYLFYRFYGGTEGLYRQYKEIPHASLAEILLETLYNQGVPAPLTLYIAINPPL